jgi:hypothetical protein
MSSYNSKIGWRMSKANVCSGSMALRGLESRPLPRRLPRSPLRRENLVQASSAHGISRTGATFKRSSQHSHSNSHIGIPCFREQLLQVLRANPGIGRESLCSQMEKLIVGPFQATQIPTLIIIDALDECRDEEPASALLSVLSRYVDKIPLVKFFITGRPEPRIRSGFRLESLRPHTDVLRLHDVEPDLVDSDIKLFLKTQLTDIAKNRSNCNFVEDWPSPQDIDTLCKKAAGFFIYASTVVKFVASQYHPPDERLALIISLPQDTSHEGKLGIDLLYTQVLEQASSDVDQDFYSHFKSGGWGSATHLPPTLNKHTLRPPWELWHTIQDIQHSTYPPFSPPCPRQHGRSSLHLP